MAREKFYTQESLTGVQASRLFRKNFDCEHGYNNQHTAQPDFSILLPDHFAEELKAKGWRVKYRTKKDDPEVQEAYIKVNIKTYDNPELQSRNPIIDEMVNGKVERMDVSEIGRLQRTRIKSVSLKIRPYCGCNGFDEFGATAYLVRMNVFPLLDELDQEAEEYVNSYENGINADDEDDEEAPFA